MGDDQVFVLDADVFIGAKNGYYAFDIAPLFWESLIEHAEIGRICSIDHVKTELERGNDQLTTWVKNEFAHAFTSTDEENIIKYYSEIINWVNNNDQFLDIGKSDFAKGADGWLVAYAKENNCIVVTQEVQDDNIKRKVPIPNVCAAFDLEAINTFEMLRQLGIKFS